MISNYEGAKYSLVDNYVQTEIIFDLKSSSSSANQILQTSDYYMWFETYNGLTYYKTRLSMEDSKGNIWVTSSKGISIIGNEVIDAVETMSTFGIPSVFQLIIDENDLVWLGTSNGIYQMSKKQLLDAIYNDNKENKLIPPMVITNVRVDGIDNYNPTSIVMKTNSKHINIYFTALSYINPEEIKFMYRLKGYEDEWSGPTTIRNISYTNLQGGKYIFELKVGNNDGVMFYLFYHIRIKQMKGRQAILKKIVIESISCLTSTIEAKDHKTEGHSIRVADKILLNYC